MKNCTDLKVMHFMEEIGNDENYLDEPEENVNIEKEDEG